MLKFSSILLALPLSAAEPWKRHTIDNTSVGADGVRLADINKDGLMDIATAWEEGGIVRAYLHPGTENPTGKWPAVTVGSVTSPEDAVFADLDQDGFPDVISSCEGKTKSLYVHWAPKAPLPLLDPEHWETEPIPAVAGKQQWMFALPMQIDGSHGPDLFIGSKGKNASLGWLQAPENPRDLAAWTYHKLQPAGWIMSLLPADLNGDGLTDLLVSDRHGKNRGIYWLENPGPAQATNPTSWKRHNIGGHDREIMFLSLGDLDQDGTDDIIAIDKKSILWYRLENNLWIERIIPLPEGVGTGKCALVCDINLDGKNDLVFTCEHAASPLSGIRWLSWENSPLTGPWIDHEISGPQGTKFDLVFAYDIDGDGDLDLVSCEETDQLGVFWYENPTLNKPSPPAPPR